MSLKRTCHHLCLHQALLEECRQLLQAQLQLVKGPLVVILLLATRMYSLLQHHSHQRFFFIAFLLEYSLALLSRKLDKQLTELNLGPLFENV
jgi:uncharacterized membrane protein